MIATTGNQTMGFQGLVQVHLKKTLLKLLHNTNKSLCTLADICEGISNGSIDLYELKLDVPKATSNITKIVENVLLPFQASSKLHICISLPDTDDREYEKIQNHSKFQMKNLD